MSLIVLLPDPNFEIVFSYLGKEYFRLVVNKRWKKIIGDICDKIINHNVYCDSHGYNSEKYNPIFQISEPWDYRVRLTFYKIVSFLSEKDRLTSQEQTNNKVTLYSYIYNSYCNNLLKHKSLYVDKILEIIQTPNFAEYMKKFGLKQVFDLLYTIFIPFFKSYLNKKLILSDNLFKFVDK